MIGVMSEREINQKSANDVPSFEIGHEQGLHRVSQQIRAEDVPSETNDKDGAGSPAFTSGGELIRLDEVRASNLADFGGRVEKSIHGSELMAVPSGDFSATWIHGYQIGDMVWGKVKSHPWWPGHIYNEAFASPSVRRTKREGHLLVAFFGDSSYGWFDPEELIPFEPHYSEKSRQTSARTFLKAVEEATDEASRRGALAVTCKCRNPYNFRSTGVPGYFAVDVFGYEHGGIYSSEQIKNIRDSFDPAGMLSFVKGLACSPRTSAYRARSDMQWIRNISMILAYRRAIFEEYDEPYAEAFGLQPVRPSGNEFGVLGQTERFAPRAAPLSGLLVIPEALGAKKAVPTTTTTTTITSSIKSASSAHKPAKVSSSKKNKYEFKRREEPYYPSNFNPFSAQQQHGISYSESAGIPLQQQFQQQNVHQYVPQGEAVDTKQAQVAEYVLQKRSPSFVRQESFRNERDAMQGVNTDGAGVHAFPETFGESKPQDDRAFAGAQPDLFSPANIQAVADSGSFATEAGSMTFMAPPVMVQESKRAAGVKVAKLPKRKREDGIPARTDDLGLVKKKKLKKESGIAVGPQRLQKKSAAGKPFGGVSSVPARPESAQGDLPRRGVVGNALLQLPKVDIGSMNIEFPQVITDLSELAINPFYGSQVNVPSIVSHIILKFRSLVYQKSLVLPPASETETAEFRAAKLAAGRVLLEQQGNVNVEMVVAKESAEQREPAQPSSVRQVKPSLRPDDPTKSGRKRGPSNRQEEISVKRVKKLTQVKTLAAEKKAGLVQKPSEKNRQDQEATKVFNPSPVPSVSRPVSRAPLSKKEEAPEATKVVSPTYLVMKFPPNSTLPSIASMKAKFARFGTLETDSFRVYWKSLTCKVLFRHRVDAVAAYSFGRSNDMFGYKVNYSIRDADVPVTESQDSSRRPEPKAEGTQFGTGNGNAGSGMSLNPLRPLQQPRQQSVQLKSILKKPNDDVSGSGTGPVKESQRVKFMLGGDDVRKEPPSIVASNKSGVRLEVPMESVGLKPLSVSSMNYIPPTQPLARPSLSQHPRFQQPLRLPELHPPAPQFQQAQPQPPRLSESHTPASQFQQPPRISELHSPAPQFQQTHRLPELHHPQPPRLPDVHYRSLGQPMPQPPPQLQPYAPEGRNRTQFPSSAESTRPILLLLFKCCDIMKNLESNLGYIPYHGL
ncbi:DNA (cytosine-5-)-methyltransferase protein [Dioscorea alata]|uniref:DNA (Cytosine-5-)-methyltransferase protein n=1 Tax=Dioscorea alata TaxID=55571 RepID=A0ACB7U3T0_DIOAL|nr:DNA (cytosine-5-)-methyltransferase protein [Dioscorea alata]